MRLLKSHTPSKNQGHLGEVATVLKQTEILGYQVQVAENGNVSFVDERAQAMNAIRMDILDAETQAKVVKGNTVNYQVGVNDRTDALALTDHYGKEVLTSGDWREFADKVIVYMQTESLKTSLFLSYLSTILPETTEATFLVSNYTTANDYTECKVDFCCNGEEMQFAFIVEGFDIKMVNETKGTGASSAFMSSRENFSTSHKQFGDTVKGYFMDKIAELTPEFDLEYVNQIITSANTVAGFLANFEKETNTIKIMDYRKVYCEDIVNDSYMYNDNAFSINEESLFTADPVNLHVKISTLGVLQIIDDCGAVYVETDYNNLGIDLYNLLYSMSFHSVLIFSMCKKIYGEGVNFFVDAATQVKGAYVYDTSILQQHEDKVFLFVNGEAVLGIEPGVAFEDFIEEAKQLTKLRFLGVDVDDVKADVAERTGVVNIQVESNGIDANFYAGDFVLALTYEEENQEYLACSYVKEVLRDEKHFNNEETYKKAIADISFDAALEFSQVAQEVFQGTFNKVSEFIYEHKEQEFVLRFGLGTVELVKGELVLSDEFSDAESLYEVLKAFRHKLDHPAEEFAFAEEEEIVEPDVEPTTTEEEVEEEEKDIDELAYNEDGTYNPQGLTKALNGVVDQFDSHMKESEELSKQADAAIAEAEKAQQEIEEEEERLRQEEEARLQAEREESEAEVEVEEPAAEEEFVEPEDSEEDEFVEPEESMEEEFVEQEEFMEPEEFVEPEESMEEEFVEPEEVEEPTTEEEFMEPEDSEEEVEEFEEEAEDFMEEIEDAIEDVTETMEEETEESVEEVEEPMEEEADDSVEEPVEESVDESVEEPMEDEVEESVEEEEQAADSIDEEVVSEEESATEEVNDTVEVEDETSNTEEDSNKTEEDACEVAEEPVETEEEPVENEEFVEVEESNESTTSEMETPVVENDSTIEIEESDETTEGVEVSNHANEEEETVKKELEEILLDIENFWDEDEAVEEVVAEEEVTEIPKEVQAIVDGEITKVVIANLVDTKGVVKAVRFGTNLGVFDMDVKAAKAGGVPIQKVTKRSKLIEVNGMVTTNYEKQNRVVVLDVTEYADACQKLIDALFN